MKHTTISASGAHRWMNCTKSTELCRVVPKPLESTYATEGTAAHKELEELVHKYINLGDDIVTKDPDSIRPEFLALLEWLAEEDVVEICIEQRLENFGISGQVDYYYLPEPETGVIIDLKWGEGQPVVALDNPQLAFYACALAKKHKLKKVHTYIYQPRGDFFDTPFQEWMLDEQLIDMWNMDFYKALQHIKRGHTEYRAGSWCGWCPAKALCPLKHEVMRTNVDLRAEVDSLSVDQIEKISKHSKEIIKWLKSVEELAYNMATNGYNFKELKLVEGRSRRYWIDDEEHVAQELSSRGVVEPFNKKLKGITEVERELGKGAIDDLTEKPVGKPTLVPIEDKREPIQQVVSELTEFDDGLY